MSGQTITKTLGRRAGKAGFRIHGMGPKLPGFGVRVRPTGAKSFIIVYRAATGRTAPVRRLHRSRRRQAGARRQPERKPRSCLGT